eukprot:11552_1
MVKYNFKDIGVVPSATEFVDIMLSRTNRQTPTVVRSRWKISSIRSFYMRKVRFTQENINKRLTQILSEFPKLDSIHPFYSDLMNVLYDRDHYKIALSQLNISRQLINNIGRDYIKLLKYGDSLYRCKHLKIAALGRMVKILKQQKSSLLYLEKVRQHLSRLPIINPYDKTILLIGFPSCGKSTFINNITNTNIETAQYPFTTKSLYIGHTNYNYLTFQIIDSPGLLNRPLIQKNTIEMQTITALAHLNSLILYFIDISSDYYDIKSQTIMFSNLLPLFNNKPIIIVCNKNDIKKFDQLSNYEKNLINNLKCNKIMEMNQFDQNSFINVKNNACDMLLSHRIQNKNNDKLSTIENRLFIAKPTKRDNKIREITKKPLVDNTNNNTQSISIKQVELNNGGPGVFNFDKRQHWNLKNNEWKFDPIPQFYNGKNILDFYQPNIDKQLLQLENEEMNIDIDNNNSNNNNNYELTDDDKLLNLYILRKHNLMRKESSHNRKIRNSRPQIPRNDKKIPISQLKYSFDDLGINTHKISKTIKINNNKKNESLYNRRGRSKIRQTQIIINNNDNNNNNNLSGLDFQQISRMQSRSKSITKPNKLLSKQEYRKRSRSKSKGPPSKGISSITASQTAQKLKRKAIMALNKQGKTHESDRKIYNTKPLHLFKGKNRPKGR